MSTHLNIVGISGSLRKESFNTSLLKHAQDLLPENATLTLLPIGDIPLYNGDIEKPLPAPVKKLKEAVQAADGILFATPEYNFSVSGVLKNAIDWLSRPYGENSLRDKPVAIMSASSGMLGGGRAQYHLRQMMVELEAHTMGKPEMIVTFAGEKWKDGTLTDEKTREKLKEHLAAFVGWMERLA